MIKEFGRYIVWGCISVCYFVNAQFTQIPRWFQETPENKSCIFAVGIANRYSNDLRSFMAAREDGVGNLIRSSKVRVRSGLAQYVVGSSIEVKSFTTEEIDSMLYKIAGDNAVVLDSVLTNKQAIVLLGWNKESSKNSESCTIPWRLYKINTKPLQQPHWVRLAPKKRGYMYGVGMGKSYSDLARSWNESAKNGRLEIGKQIKISQSKLEYHHDSGGDFEKSWMEEVVDVTLKGAIVKERWYDTERDIYYTLIEYRIPK